MKFTDATAEGRSVTNAVGEVPMFSFGSAAAGKPAPRETAALWAYSAALKPAAYMEFHTHYQDIRPHKLNPMALEWFPGGMHARVERVDRALLALNAEWRMVPITRGLPLSEYGKFVNLTERFQTLSYCYQIYAATEEATCAHAVSVVSTLARALAGPDWEAEKTDQKIEAG